MQLNFCPPRFCFTYDVRILQHHHFLQHCVCLVPHQTPQALREPRLVWWTAGGEVAQDKWGDGQVLRELRTVETEARVHRSKHSLMVTDITGHCRETEKGQMPKVVACNVEAVFLWHALSFLSTAPAFFWLRCACTLRVLKWYLSSQKKKGGGK